MFANNLFFLLFSSCLPGLESAQCDLFQSGLLCSLDISNILAAISGLENESVCQEQCALPDSNCNFFMFIEFESRESECFLLTDCNATNVTTCSTTPDCRLSITGPKTPKITDACCDQFEEVTCEIESEIGHFYQVGEASECQNICRDTSGCQYWSLYVQVCFLYSVCTTPVSCSSVCTSGPLFPNVSACDKSKDIFYTLVLGGITSCESYSTSVELITDNTTCSPQMEQLPVARRFAAAAVLGSRIFYCGGYDGQYHRSCHSNDLGVDDDGGILHPGWQEEESMVVERGRCGFSVAADENTLLASGGKSNEGPLSSVEVFTPEAGWRLEPKLEMASTKYEHCSVVIGTLIYTIGGVLDGTSTSDISNMVEAYDTSLNSCWIKKASMKERRYGHGCHVGVFEGQEGIFVAGGRDENGGFLASAEFYNPAEDAWQVASNWFLNKGRAYFPMSMVGERLIVSGGADNDNNPLTSVEAWDGTSWVELTSLKMGRKYHAAVTVMAGKLSCA